MKHGVSWRWDIIKSGQSHRSPDALSAGRVCAMPVCAIQALGVVYETLPVRTLRVTESPHENIGRPCSPKIILPGQEATSPLEVVSMGPICSTPK
jgi:hypothetical protein